MINLFLVAAYILTATMTVPDVPNFDNESHAAWYVYYNTVQPLIQYDEDMYDFSTTVQCDDMVDSLYRVNPKLNRQAIYHLLEEMVRDEVNNHPLGD